MRIYVEIENSSFFKDLLYFIIILAFITNIYSFRFLIYTKSTSYYSMRRMSHRIIAIMNNKIGVIIAKNNLSLLNTRNRE